MFYREKTVSNSRHSSRSHCWIELPCVPHIRIYCLGLWEIGQIFAKKARSLHARIIYVSHNLQKRIVKILTYFLRGCEKRVIYLRSVRSPFQYINPFSCRHTLTNQKFWKIQRDLIFIGASETIGGLLNSFAPDIQAGFLGSRPQRRIAPQIAVRSSFPSPRKLLPNHSGRWTNNEKRELTQPQILMI